VARRQSALTVRTDVSASAATVLPGVSLPAWAYVPEPALEPLPESMTDSFAALVREPEPSYAGAIATSEPAYAPAPLAPLAYPAPSYPVAAAAQMLSPAVVDYPLAPAMPLTAFAPVPDTLWGPPAANTAVGADIAPPLPGELPYDATYGAAPPTDHHAPVDESAAAPKQRGSRRTLMLVGGLVVALLLGAFAAFVTPGFLVSSSDGTDTNAVATTTPHVLLPPSHAGYAKVSSPAATAANTAATSALSAAGATGVAAATYSKGTSAQVTVASGLLSSVPTAAQKARLISAWAASVAATGTTTVVVPQATAQCGTRTGGAVCIVIAGRKVTTLNVPGVTAAQAAALVPTFAEFATVR
jgi:hypothetical protein